MPDCVAHCSYVSLHKQFLRYNTRSEQLLLDLKEAEKRELFVECEKQCRIDSKSVNHNRYFNDDYQKYCHSQITDQIASPSQNRANTKDAAEFHNKIEIVLARPNESCHAACSRLDEDDPLTMLPGHK